MNTPNSFKGVIANEKLNFLRAAFCARRDMNAALRTRVCALETLISNAQNKFSNALIKFCKAEVHTHKKHVPGTFERRGRSIWER